MAPSSQVCTLCPMWADCELLNLLREMRRECEPEVAITEISAGTPFPIQPGKLYAVRSGVVKEMWMQTAQRGRIVDFGFPGRLIGLEASLGFGNPQKAYAAIQRSSLCRAFCVTRPADPAAVFPQARLSSELARRIVPVYALSWMIQADAATRVAHYLVKVAKATVTTPSPARQPLPNIPRPDIADYLGLRPESVSRVLSQFRAAGWIRGKIDRIEVINFDAIKAKSEQLG